MSKPTQYEMIIHHMRMTGSITKKEAAPYNIYDLPGRIRDLKHKGVNIITLTEDNVTNNSRHSRYVLAKTELNNQILKELGYIK